ncbi:hypothetical protein Q8F55_006191 [Vanrija albida]|uniref:Uncharacterized protein n=1 Tax=Vanrija albida TaxID=181172 RepID=A0ABR3PWC8_9TREE
MRHLEPQNGADTGDPADTGNVGTGVATLSDDDRFRSKQVCPPAPSTADTQCTMTAMDPPKAAAANKMKRSIRETFREMGTGGDITFMWYSGTIDGPVDTFAICRNPEAGWLTRVELFAAARIFASHLGQAVIEARIEHDGISGSVDMLQVITHDGRTVRCALRWP